MAQKHEDEPAVPIYSTLDEVYGDGSQLEEAQLRFNVLNDKFKDVFGCVPDVYARAPG
ncbi:Galactokinase [Artemisia annua]|uniref:Galactokinase n=1 Tax=Artemisia annua TaxID=35608 RepID=A0A2U1NB15_ARTAN|nr:Galactokinase [Artemisia annua]